MSLYSRNLYFGKSPFENAAVVDGVSVVAKPMTPIFTPFANENKLDEVCLGRKFFSPLYDLKFAAIFGASLADMKGNKKFGPKSNSWFPIAEPST